ncbi:MAG: hypothetical protein ACJAYV_000326 [Oleispira sp.]|jgi:hypothetical protein
MDPILASTSYLLKKVTSYFYYCCSCRAENLIINREHHSRDAITPIAQFHFIRHCRDFKNFLDHTTHKPAMSSDEWGNGLSLTVIF